MSDKKERINVKEYLAQFEDIPGTSTDKKSFQFAAGSMTGMTQEEYAEMMLKGGRSPDGVRSVKGGY